MRNLFFTLFALIIPVFSANAAWQERVDSLKNILQQTTIDTIKIQLYIELGKEVLSNTPEASLEYFNHAQKLAEEINDTSYKVKSLLALSSFYNMVNEYSSSLELVYQAMKMAKNNTVLLALCHSRLAAINHMIEEYDVAIYHNRIALSLDRINHDNSRIAVDYHSMGTLFLETDDFDSALYYLYSANNLSIQLAGRPNSYNLSHIGLTYTYLGKYDSALFYHFEALKYDSIDERNYEIAVDLYYIALTYFNSGNYNKTSKYAQQSEKLSKELKLYDILLLNYELFYQVFEKLGNYKDAYQYALLRNSYADSLRTKGKESLIQSLNAKYKFEEKEKQLVQAKQENHLLEKQKTLLVILSLVSILFLVSTVIIIVQIHRRQRATRLLLEELEKANQSKDRLISIISHDLRGSIGNLRNAVELIVNESLDFETTKGLMKSFYPVVDSTYDLLENLLTWAKYGKENLEPIFEHIDVKQLIEKSILHTSHLAVSKNIVVKNYVDNFTVITDRNMLLTIIRNLISNAIKFSHPKSEVIISCATTLTVAEIKVTDNGIGMKESVLGNIFSTPVDYHSKGTMGERGSGLGLSICKNFIDILGGEIWAESVPGKGSAFYLTIPIDTISIP
jgi:signal transduction histidine kinase